jgi:hypothetical protein
VPGRRGLPQWRPAAYNSQFGAANEVNLWRTPARPGFRIFDLWAKWQSGHAAACKAVYAGSIPTLASRTAFPTFSNLLEDPSKLPTFREFTASCDIWRYLDLSELAGVHPGVRQLSLGVQMLNDTAVRSAMREARSAQKPIKRFDQGGLFLLATANGGGLWRFKYQFDGREKLIGLGKFPDVNLKQARDRRDNARKLRLLQRI